MYKKHNQSDDARIWANLDFEKVKDRINRVNLKIERVLQKHELSGKTRNSNKKDS